MRPYEGLLTAMVTPFRADGSVDEEKAVDIGRHLLANGSHGLVVAGTTGEAGPKNHEGDPRPIAPIAPELGGEATGVGGAGAHNTPPPIPPTPKTGEDGGGAPGPLRADRRWAGGGGAGGGWWGPNRPPPRDPPDRKGGRGGRGRGAVRHAVLQQAQPPRDPRALQGGRPRRGRHTGDPLQHPRPHGGEHAAGPAPRTGADRRHRGRQAGQRRRAAAHRRPGADGRQRRRLSRGPRARWDGRHLRRQPHRRPRDAPDVRRAGEPRGDRRVAARYL